jgi:hypothetical protein
MNLECPYCEADCGQPDEVYPGMADEEEECPKCGKSFLYDCEYEPLYYARKTPCLNGEPHDYRPIPYSDPPWRRCEACRILEPKVEVEE